MIDDDDGRMIEVYKMKRTFAASLAASLAAFSAAFAAFLASRSAFFRAASSAS